MKSTVNHIIHKQTIDIRFSNFTNANSWDAAKQAETAEAVRRSIEKCLEGYDSAKEYLTIDKLEFDLGVFSADQLLSKMPEKLYRELQKILNSYRQYPDDFEQVGFAEGESSINIWSVLGADKRTAVPIVKNSEVTAFLFFLQHGYLPSWYSNEPAWKPEWLLELNAENWQKLRNFLRIYREDEIHYEPALSRLISQFSDGFLASLLKGLQLEEQVERAWSWLARVYEAWQKSEPNPLRSESSPPSLSVLRRNFWKASISYAVGRSAVPKLTTLFTLIKEPSLISYFLSLVTENNEWMDSIPNSGMVK